MKWVTGAIAALALAAAALAAVAITSRPAVVRMAPAAATAPAHPAPSRAATRPAPEPTKTIYVTPPPAQSPAPAQPASAPAQPQLTNGPAVVLQYYQDVTDQEWSAAWAIGGSNLSGGTGYDAWVAGYDTTASIRVTAYGTYSDGSVWTTISAVQDDGTVRTYSGTYTVENGVIVSASLTQTS
jgi:hypothetical protein